MKRILKNILLIVGISGAFVTQLAAQELRMTADIPFAFVVDNRTMPAGHYDLSQWTANGSAFSLREVSGKTIFLQLNVREDGKPGKPSLTFACYGKDCVLAKITPPDSMTAYSLGQKSIENHLHHTLGMASMASIKLTAY